MKNRDPHPAIALPSHVSHQLFNRVTPKTSPPSSIDEAGDLVRQCAEPRPAGDKVKAAVIRASRRLGFSFSRTKDIWYRGARRIDSTEMDQLRRTADRIKTQQAIVSIHTLRNRFIASRSPDSCRIVKAIDDTLSVLSRETEGTE